LLLVLVSCKMNIPITGYNRLETKESLTSGIAFSKNYGNKRDSVRKITHTSIPQHFILYSKLKIRQHPLEIKTYRKVNETNDQSKINLPVDSILNKTYISDCKVIKHRSKILALIDVGMSLAIVSALLLHDGFTFWILDAGPVIAIGLLVLLIILNIILYYLIEKEKIKKGITTSEFCYGFENTLILSANIMLAAGFIALFAISLFPAATLTAFAIILALLILGYLLLMLTLLVLTIKQLTNYIILKQK
jgi:hypothetical protein